VKLFDKLITRYLFNESDSKEQKEVEKALETDNTLAKEVKKFQQLLSMKSKKQKITNVDTKWNQLRQDIESIEKEKSAHFKSAQKSKMFSPWYHRFNTQLIMRYAAVLILIFGMGYLIKFQPFKTDQLQMKMDYKIIKADHKERFTVTLSDGSRITLDAGTELRYPNNFVETRDVYLSGEAYFEVAQNKQKPFQVHSGNALIKVLGTKFNVRNWDDNNQIIVTVNEGRVSLQAEDSTRTNKVILMQNQQSTIDSNGKLSVPKRVDASQYIAWMNNEILFEHATVREVLAQLERWYDFDFVITDSTILNGHVTTHLKKTNVMDALQVISKLTNTKIEKNENCIRISSR
jgi:ferric-dicitrate binding protein FerR (iron transport regulator)